MLLYSTFHTLSLTFFKASPRISLTKIKFPDFSSVANVIRYFNHTKEKTAITCLPLPLPWEAPSMIPGRSSSWIFAPLYSITPGIQVRVVNSYDAASLCVVVNVLSNVDCKQKNVLNVKIILLTTNYA